MGKTALVVLDVQNIFITDSNKLLPDKIKKHIETQNYDFIIFSRFINSENSSFTQKLNWKEGNHSPAIDIVPELSELALKNHIFEKSTYSLFKSKNVVTFLAERNISKLFFCGVDLDACVLASAFEAFDLGFEFEILVGLTGSSAKDDLNVSAKHIIKRNLQPY